MCYENIYMKYDLSDVDANDEFRTDSLKRTDSRKWMKLAKSNAILLLKFETETLVKHHDRELELHDISYSSFVVFCKLNQIKRVLQSS